MRAFYRSRSGKDSASLSIIVVKLRISLSRRANVEGKDLSECRLSRLPRSNILLGVTRPRNIGREIGRTEGAEGGRAAMGTNKGTMARINQDAVRGVGERGGGGTGRRSVFEGSGLDSPTTACARARSPAVRAGERESTFPEHSSSFLGRFRRGGEGRGEAAATACKPSGVRPGLGEPGTSPSSGTVPRRVASRGPPSE